MSSQESMSPVKPKKDAFMQTDPEIESKEDVINTSVDTSDQSFSPETMDYNYGKEEVKF